MVAELQFINTLLEWFKSQSPEENTEQEDEDDLVAFLRKELLK
jgi:hypothetical protein